MNLAEFKAWFDGFTENLDGRVPSTKAWKRIRERVSEIKAEPTPIQRIVHEYPWYRPLWLTNYPTFVGTIGNTSGLDAIAQNTAQSYQGTAALNSTECFQDIGRHEALAMN